MSPSLVAGLAALAGLALSLDATAHAGHALEPAPEPVATDGPLFEPPTPGSYELPAIERVRDRVLLGTDGSPAPILGLEKGRLAIVSFVYTHCSQADGCPLALSTLRHLDRALVAAGESRVRLVTLSFDPARDTPEKMAELRDTLEPHGDWRFLTAATVAQLRPVLRDFGQDVTQVAPGGVPGAAVLRHVLKVFLVDAQGRVRNVYSTGFLDPRIILGDVETLLGPAPRGGS